MKSLAWFFMLTVLSASLCLAAGATNVTSRQAMELMAGRLHGEARQGYVIVPPVLVTRQTIDSEVVKETLDLAWFQP